MKLIGYWRSGTSYRTRIALNLKGLSYEYEAVDLRTGAHKADDYLALNPQGLVPSLVTDDHQVLTQSPAIIEWLEETHPEPALLPTDPVGRARVRAMAAIIGCDVHPLNNLRVLKAIKGLGADEEASTRWTHEWMSQGFTALEVMVGQWGGQWAYGDQPGLVECYLLPQIYSAQRFGYDLSVHPRLMAIYERTLEHSAFTQAHPDNQPDAD